MLRGVSSAGGATPSTPGLLVARPTVIPIQNQSAGGTFTSMPLAATNFLGASRFVKPFDLTNYTQIRFIVNKQGVTGVTGSKLILRYFATGSFTASDYLDIGTSEVSVAVDTTNIVLVTSWIDIAPAAKADVFINVIGTGGDGVASPAFGAVEAQVR